ncbi:hypothetical protein DMA11_07005 [Marinilabiliaceae bacterium JC017]|nr:hypothetical protein DMA11_07005 [Marinilabiliaceae bacterium JC017]
MMIRSRAGPSNKRAGVGATKRNAGILACGLAKIHRGGFIQLAVNSKQLTVDLDLLRFWGDAKNEVRSGTTSRLSLTIMRLRRSRVQVAKHMLQTFDTSGIFPTMLQWLPPNFLKYNT